MLPCMVGTSPELLSPLATAAAFITQPHIWPEYLKWADEMRTAKKGAPFTDGAHTAMLTNMQASKQWADEMIRATLTM